MPKPRHRHNKPTYWSNKRIFYAVLILFAASASIAILYRLVVLIMASQHKVSHQPAYQPTLMPRINPELSTAIQNAHIACSEEFLSELNSRPQGPSLINMINEQIVMIRRTLPKIMRQHKLLKKILADETFMIQLVPFNDLTLVGHDPVSPQARYLPT